jgi:hypothetical protein
MRKLSPGVRITGQVVKVYDWIQYLNNPAAQKQIKALKAFKNRIRRRTSNGRQDWSSNLHGSTNKYTVDQYELR